MLLPAIFYIAWDIYFTSENVWSFNPAYITGIKIGNLPLEEVLFFFVVPYCCMFIYECVRCYFPSIKDGKTASLILKLLGLILFVTGSIFFSRLYTGHTFVLTGIFIAVLFLFKKYFVKFHVTAFLISFLICLVPFLIVNGFLTAIPVVLYNDAENLGTRIYTIPFEDVFYGMLLIMMNIAIYEKLKRHNNILFNSWNSCFKIRVPNIRTLNSYSKNIAMEFGRVPESSLNKIKFELPADPAFNKKILKGKPAKDPKVYLGCAKWGRKEWVGKIYPPKTKEKDFLDNYVHHYNSIELNATHYQVYKEDTITKWSDKAGKKDFLFCPKMYKGVTHFGSLKGKEFITTEFLKGVLAFKKHLGPIFVQVSESFAPKRKEELFEYLQSLPTDLQFFLEVRHPEWFSDKAIMEALVIKLKSLNMGIVITDTSGRRDCAHMFLTIPKTFIRYVGNSLHKTDYTRIDEWIERMKFWLDNGLQELYFFMHMHDEATSPELTVYLVDKMNEVCGLSLPKPKFVAEQKDLFG